MALGGTFAMGFAAWQLPEAQTRARLGATCAALGGLPMVFLAARAGGAGTLAAAGYLLACLLLLAGIAAESPAARRRLAAAVGVAAVATLVMAAVLVGVTRFAQG